MGKLDRKQFPLDNKENCCVYLVRIISSCELCMDRFKIYNKQTEELLKKYEGKESVPQDVYMEMCDKTYNIIGYLSNLLGDCQQSSISYFKYRSVISKRIRKGNNEIPLLDISEEVSDQLSEFNKIRNWQNHIPESLLVAEVAQIERRKLELPMDPVQIIHYKNVTYEYFEHMYLSNKEFCNNSRMIIQHIKREYAMLMGKKISYPRLFSEKLYGFEDSATTRESARVQGLKGEDLVE